VSVNDLLTDAEVLRIRNAALSAYCRHFSGKIFVHLKFTAESGDVSSGFKMSQFTNFTDKCQAECIHHAGKSPLSDPYLSQVTVGTEMDVLLPATDLFAPFDIRAGSSAYVQYAAISQEMNHWEKNPNHRPLNVITRMGITLNKYLKNLQKKTMLWALDADIDASNPDSFRNLADKHNFNYILYKKARDPQGGLQTCDTESDSHCTCGPPPGDSNCGALPTNLCYRTHYINVIVPHQMCMLRKILEEWQRAFLWKMFKWFNDHPTADEDSRVPVMMRRELGEKYCHHYCKVFPLSHELYTQAQETSWKTNECNQQCMIEFPRCTNLPSCLVSNGAEALFQETWEAKSVLGRLFSDLSIQNLDCSNDLVIHSKCDLTQKDAAYWIKNFPDLERAGQRREQRLKVVEMKTDEWRGDCAEFLESHGFSKTSCGPDTSGEMPRDFICSNSKNRFCNNTLCEAEKADGFNKELSIDTFAENKPEQAKCAYIDRKFTNPEFLEKVRGRFLRSVESWPQEHWTVHANHQITYMAAEEAYSMFAAVQSVNETTWGTEQERHGLNNVYNNWEFTVDSQGDLRINRNPSCTFAAKCEIDGVQKDLMSNQECYAPNALIV
jgi:hypothetical protein